VVAHDENGSEGIRWKGIWELFCWADDDLFVRYGGGCCGNGAIFNDADGFPIEDRGELEEGFLISSPAYYDDSWFGINGFRVIYTFALSFTKLSPLRRGCKVEGFSLVDFTVDVL